MIEIVVLILCSIAALCAANYAFGMLAGHVFADQAQGRRAGLVWVITLLVGLIELLFFNATTLAMTLLLIRQDLLSELDDALKAGVFLVSYLGAGFAVANGSRRSLERRIQTVRNREQ